MPFKKENTLSLKHGYSRPGKVEKLYYALLLLWFTLLAFVLAQRPVRSIDTLRLAAQYVRPPQHPNPLWRALERRQKPATPPCDANLQYHQEHEIRGMRPQERECGR